MIVTLDEVVDIGLVGLRLIVADLQDAFHGTNLLSLFILYIIHPQDANVKGNFMKII